MEALGDVIPWGSLAPVVVASGGWLLAFYFVRLVFTGEVIPKSTYLEQKEAATTWRTAFEGERQKNLDLMVPMAKGVRQVAASVTDTGELPVVRAEINRGPGRSGDQEVPS